MNNNEELLNIIVDNEKLIYAIINKVYGYYDYKDLYQVGVIGLLRAYRNFDNNFGVKFSTYAFPYILGEIKKYLREDRIIKVGRDVMRLKGAIERAKESLAQVLMREPSTMEIALFLEIEESRIIDALNINNPIQSLDYLLNGEGTPTTLYDTISDENNIDLLDKLCLKEEIEKLPSIDQQLIAMRYSEGKTQTEIATVLGLNQVQVSRQERRILTKLRENL